MKRILILLVYSFLGFAYSVNGQVSSPEVRNTVGANIYINEIRGDSIQPGAILKVEDDRMLPQGILDPEVRHSFYVNNYILFEINTMHEQLPDFNFSASVELNISIVDSLGDTTTTNVTLQVSKDSVNQISATRDEFLTERGHVISVEVLSILVSDPLALRTLVLRNEIYTTRVMGFDCEHTLSDLNAEVGLSDQTMLITWSPYDAATEYDIEWTFYGDYSSEFPLIPTATSLSPFYLNNATRVVVKNSGYLVKLGYPAGTILYRVRPVSYSPDGQRLLGKWTNSLSDYFLYDGLENQKNWLFSSAFMEEGKKKNAIEYYDGKLVKRQSITSMDADRLNLVSSFYYDLNARLAAQSLPAPAQDLSFTFIPLFNRDPSNGEFDYNDALGNSCLPVSSPMNNLYGAGNYYSSSNPDLEGWNQYIPNANGFPYIAQSYTSDMTGRIKFQGAAGMKLALGAQHEIEHHFGKPAVEELIRMFHYDFSDAQLFSKNLTVDQNGQVSVEYKDGHDRVIATALAGLNPAALTKLDYNNPLDPMVINLIADQIRNETSVSVTYPYNVSTPGQHIFIYNLEDLFENSVTGCQANTLCYDCYYDIDIKVATDCDVLWDEKITNFNISTLSNICSTPNSDLAYTETLDIEDVGVIYITKTLRLSEEALLAQVNDYIENATCSTFAQFYADAIAQMDFDACDMDCAQCSLSLGTKNNWMMNYSTNYSNANNGQQLSPEQTIAAENLYEELLSKCKQLCEEYDSDPCGSLLDQLKIDVTIGGQYCLYESDPSNQTIMITDPTSLLFSSSACTLAPYADPSLLYKELDGSPSEIEVNGVIFTPNQLSAADFVRYWRDSWADELVKKHPEYCYYEFCLNHKASFEFDAKLQAMTTVDEFLAEFNNPIPDLTSYNFLNDIDPLNSGFDMNWLNGNFNPPDIAELQSLTTAMPNLYQYALFNISPLVKQHFPPNSSPPPFDITTLDYNDLCDGDKNYFFNFYKTIYLAIKNCYYNKILENQLSVVNSTSCPGSCVNRRYIGSDNQDTYFPMGFNMQQGNGIDYGSKVPRFLLYLPVNPTAPCSFSKFSSQDEILAMQPPLATQMMENVEQNCEAFEEQWRLQLAGCGFSTSTLDAIIIEMLNLCKVGGDATHPIGASTLDPTNTDHTTGSDYLSFQEILEDLGSVNPNDPNCNALLIDMPPPYDQVLYPNTTVVVSEVPICVCDKLNNYVNEFNALFPPTPSINFTNFSNYLANKYGSKLTADELEELVTFCAGTTDCSYLKDAIELPEILQCKTCKNCEEVIALIDAFNTDHPSWLNHVKYHNLLANHLNNSFGFNFLWEDYEKFLEGCNQETDCEKAKRLYDEWVLTNPKKYPLSGFLNINMVVTYSNIEWLEFFASCSLIVNSNYFVPLNVSNNQIPCEILGELLINYWSDASVDISSTWATTLNTFFTTNYFDNISNAQLLTKVNDCNLNAYYNLTNDDLCDQVQQIRDNIIAGSLVPIIFLEEAIVNSMQSSIFGNVPDQYCYNIIRKCGIPIEGKSCIELNIKRNNYLSSIPVNTTFYDYLNDQWNYSYLPEAYDLFVEHCGEPVEHVLCYTEPFTISGEDDNDCIDQLLISASANAELSYQLYIEARAAEFINDMRDKCLSHLNETFTLEFANREYHYTLYYYDRAGNLVQTVPPNGVSLLTNSEIAQIMNGTQIAINDHTYKTTYKYNSLNKVVEQTSPDVNGITRFWYDHLGRLVLSQNPEQEGIKNQIFRDYSFTIYDDLNRIIEVGQVRSPFQPSAVHLASPTAFYSYVYNLNTTITEHVKTYYDEVTFPIPGFTQQNLLSRIAHVTKEDYFDADPLTYNSATHYSYDVLGNVSTIAQENTTLQGIGNDIKKMEYGYDLVSGKVNEVVYQPNQPDQFVHRYIYDEDNRLREAGIGTNTDQVYMEANYSYFKHGPLARKILGESVQGVDYAYTINGWLKAINASGLVPGREMGRDGFWDPTFGASESKIARDVFAQSISYHIDDYEPIAGVAVDPELNHDNSVSDWITDYGANLYNGNIRSVTSEMKRSPIMGTAYLYDQLNRLVGTQTATNPNIQEWRWDAAIIQDGRYQENISYDPNGNINNYTRMGDNNQVPGVMDQLSYSYMQNHPTQPRISNQLYKVVEAVNTPGYDNDIEEPITEYTYDKIGNLISERDANGNPKITSTWNNFGKLASVDNFVDDSRLEFNYDPMGNRIEKKYFPEASNRNHYISDFYVRDAQGNIMATYKYEFDFANSVNRFDLEEFHMYGSSRIGTIQLGFPLYENGSPNPNWTEPITNLRVGHKRYELTNHLGNVMAVVNDRTQGVHADADGIIDYYEATVLKANDYYPFGSLMPGREYSAGDYRFSFNGQERTDEIAGTGNHNTALYWEYDTRLGRRWNVDPVPQIFLSEYTVLSLNPIRNIDPNGDSYSPIFDAETGDYLGADSEGFNRGEVLYMDRAKFLELSEGNTKTIDKKVAVENSLYTNKTLPDNSKGLELFKKSSNTISHAIYKAYEKTKPSLENNSIYVDRFLNGDLARYDEASISSGGEWLHRVIFNFNRRTDYLNTPMNIFSVFLHEYEGHGKLSLNNAQHGEIYLMQYKHPSYKLLSETMQKHIMKKLNDYGVKY